MADVMTCHCTGDATLGPSIVVCITQGLKLSFRPEVKMQGGALSIPEDS